MKKTLQRITSLLVVAVMLMSAVPSFALFETCNYVSLGDSVVNGYGLDDYSSSTRGYKQKVREAYPYLVAQELNADLEQMAFSGFRAEELHYVLDEDYKGDDYLYRCFYGDPLFERCGGGIEKMRREYKEAITNADYITLQIGSNNFGTYLQMQLTRYMAGEETFKFDRDDYENGTISPEYSAAEKSVKDYLNQAMDAVGLVDFMLKCLRYTYAGFIQNYDEVIEHIYELNPDVNLVVVGMYNLFDGVYLTNNMVDLGSVVGAFLNLVNKHMRDKSPRADEYTYVDAFECETHGLPDNITDPDFFETFTKDSGKAVHPNVNGHRYIADKIIDAIFVPFEDVNEDDDFYQAVKFAYNAGLMDEYSEDKFGPDKIATKAMIATALYRLEGSPEIDGETTFWDVKAGNDFAKSVDWAVEEGLMEGLNSKLFLPYSAMSRQKVAQLFWELAGCPETDYEITGYYDTFLISKSYKTAMAWAVENGILEGIPGKVISPRANVTRSQLAIILMRFVQL
ncbi:MAG: S-layer homology domain-containing protein [Clostridia bacterium]|nr:S-layer homology domain-containing protein [Clostridia bacterium]